MKLERESQMKLEIRDFSSINLEEVILGKSKKRICFWISINQKTSRHKLIRVQHKTLTLFNDYHMLKGMTTIFNKRLY